MSRLTLKSVSVIMIIIAVDAWALDVTALETARADSDTFVVEGAAVDVAAVATVVVGAAVGAAVSAALFATMNSISGALI